jgi:hypothetical protein
VQGAVIAGVAAAVFAVVSNPPVEARPAPLAFAVERQARFERSVAGRELRQLGHPGAHAKAALAMRPGPIVPFGQGGHRAGRGRSVPSGSRPLLKATNCRTPLKGLKKKLENQQNWLTRDPEIKCYLPGVPRATYMPFPFQIVQSNAAVFMAYEYAGAVRHIYLKDPGPPQIDSWMGMSHGVWEGDTFVVHTSGFNDQSWFDRAGNHHSDKLKVTERYTMTDADHINYEATIDDPATFTRPWKMSMPLYRRVEKNAQLGQFKCVEFVTELMYGHLRKEPIK